jgi:hypothetical protein
MRQPRISYEQHELRSQLTSAAASVATEAAWPGTAPSSAELQAVADAMDAARQAIVEAELELGRARKRLELASAEGRELMRRVDWATTALYGESHGHKVVFGLRPIDRTRNRRPVPEAVEDLRLSDGPEAGTLFLRWKPIFRASYLAEAWSGVPEVEGSVLVRATDSRKASCQMAGLKPGTRLTVRVRASTSGRTGDWSEPVSRYVNG